MYVAKAKSCGWLRECREFIAYVLHSLMPVRTAVHAGWRFAFPILDEGLKVVLLHLFRLHGVLQIRRCGTSN